jgi:predicted DNA binding CopG/RHH family protein
MPLELSGPVTGEKGENFMKKVSRKYTSAPSELAKEMETSIPASDFLPSPEQIAAMIQKVEMIPITMNVKKKTLERYKKFAQKRGIKYQVFVATLLDSYAQRL